jgi:hypothetical protein
MRSLLLALLAVVALLLVAAPADGKTGVRARLSATLPVAPAPGESITVTWTLGYRDEQRRWRPGFDACGVFVRLASAAGGPPTVGFDSGGTCRAHTGGEYAATVNVPEGGIGGIKIGLRGTTDVFFPLENDPLAAARGPIESRAKAAAPTSSPIPLVPGLTLASLVALAVGAATLKSRRGRRTLPPGGLTLAVAQHRQQRVAAAVPQRENHAQAVLAHALEAAGAEQVELAGGQGGAAG